MIKITFVVDPHLSAYPFMRWKQAEEWLDRHGFSYGTMQGPSARGIMRGDFAIAKWRSLTMLDREKLAGTMCRNAAGDVLVQLNDGVILPNRHPDPQSLKEGDDVLLLRDDGEYEYRTVKYGAWQLGHGQLVVGLHGLVGGWSADRIFVVE